MTEATLDEFLKDSGLSIEDLMPTVRLTEVEIELLQQQVPKTMAPPASADDVAAKCESKKEANALAERVRKQGFKCRVKKSVSKHEREG